MAVKKKTGVGKSSKNMSKSGSKPKGVIKSSNVKAGVKAVGQAVIKNLPVVGGVFRDLMESGVPAPQAAKIAGISGGRTKKRGLTYNEIRGAAKVLKLVKKFAPAGRKPALRIRRSR